MASLLTFRVQPLCSPDALPFLPLAAWKPCPLYPYNTPPSIYIQGDYSS